MRRTATFDPTRCYRYRLGRSWDPARPRVTFVMLNPSSADARRDDPTIRRCIGFARGWGFGGLTVVNLFGYRTADPRELARAPDPIGPDNDRALRRAQRESEVVVAAWGVHGSLRGRDHEVRNLLRRTQLQCLGTTRAGHPRHPLYLPASAALRPWR